MPTRKKHAKRKMENFPSVASAIAAVCNNCFHLLCCVADEHNVTPCALRVNEEETCFECALHCLQLVRLQTEQFQTCARRKEETGMEFALL